MKKLLTYILVILPLCMSGQSNIAGRNRSVTAEWQRNASRSATQQVAMGIHQVVDTLLTPDVPFTPMAVSMMGYSKHRNDEHESFILRNNTANYHISRVLIKLVYTTTEDGITFHNREELVECDIRPGMTRMVSIKSFDKGKNYYHHTTPPTRATGIPYEVKYDIVRYDVVVE